MNKKMFFRFVAVALILFRCIDSNAQPDNDKQIAVLKNVVPPSPNASSLGKYGEWPVSLYTGVPNVSVPVCELRGRTISVPVSLSYHGSGNKVGETPSWTGLGWTLSAGGAVTRSLRGLPDEEGYFTNAANHTNINDYSSAAINLAADAQALVGSVRNSSDVLQDIYSFNALGKSYKFILKADGSMQTIPASAVKLIANPIVGTNTTVDTWTILLEDGTKLLFGGGSNFTEVTTNPRFALLDGAGISFTSSWMLKSITTASNEVILFTYSTPVSISQDVYHSQSDFLQYSVIPGRPVTHSTSLKSTVEKQDVVTVNLATIESDLGRIEFITSSTARQDLPGSFPLQEIKVFSNRENKYIEDYILTTSYSTAVSSNVVSTPATVNDTYVNYRLRLNSLEKKDLTNATALGQKWTFDYNTQNLPPRRSTAQDHWGFFNGATSNTSILPRAYFVMDSLYAAPVGGQSLYGFFPPYHNLGGNKEGNANYLQAEMLTSIHYPTGGYSNFTYEPNSIPVSQETFTSTQLPLVLNMYANQNPPINTVTTTFVITKPQYIHLTASSYISPQILVDQPNAQTITEVIAPWGTTMGSFTNTNDKWFNLYKPGTYTFKISSNVQTPLSGTNTVNVNATVEFEQSNGVQNINKLVGGLRINKIADYDGNSAAGINERVFIYEQPYEISPINIEADYLTSQYSRNAVSTPEVADTVVTRNTSSKFSLGTVQGGTVAYGKVTTLYGTGGANGKTVSLFTNDPDDANEFSASKVFPYPPPDSKDHRRGLLLEETQYKSDLVTPLKKTTNTYGFTVTGYTRGIKAGYKMNMLGGATHCLYNIQNSCGILGAFVTNTSEQVKRLTSTSITYDNSGQNPLGVTTSYFYDNPNNMNAVRTETTDSKGNTIKSISRTPLEKADINAATPLTSTASAAIDTMLARNMISPVLQQEQYKANVLQTRSLINYKNWDGVITQPENIQGQLRSNPVETRVQFNKYDAYGNLQEQQKANDVVECYIYGYGNQYPVAKIVGTGYNTAVQYVNLTVLNSTSTTEQQMRAELNNLRTGLAGTNALVTTYTYKPLIGITSETDPNGRTTYYEYDNFNRLSVVKDYQNKVIKKICYNYAGQAENCQTAVTYYNVQASQTFTRNNCPSCQTGSQVTYSVPAGTYSSTVSQAAADQLAQNDIAANGQNYANTNGTCAQGSGVAITYSNFGNASGFTATYTGSMGTYSFSIPASGSGSLGCIPAGTYTVTISKPGNTVTRYFDIGCASTTGTSATFKNRSVSSTTCNVVMIDAAM